MIDLAYIEKRVSEITDELKLINDDLTQANRDSLAVGQQPSDKFKRFMYVLSEACGHLSVRYEL